MDQRPGVKPCPHAKATVQPADVKGCKKAVGFSRLVQLPIFIRNKKKKEQTNRKCMGILQKELFYLVMSLLNIQAGCTRG